MLWVEREKKVRKEERKKEVEGGVVMKSPHAESVTPQEEGQRRAEKREERSSSVPGQ